MNEDVIVIVPLVLVIATMAVLFGFDRLVENGTFERRPAPVGYITETNGRMWRWRLEEDEQVTKLTGPTCSKEFRTRRAAVHSAWLDKQRREAEEAAQNWRQA